MRRISRRLRGLEWCTVRGLFVSGVLFGVGQKLVS